MRRSRWLLILVAAALVGGHAGIDGPGPEAFRQLVLAPAVADNLALLFEKFDTELVVCLEGERRGEDVHVTDFRFPHILLSETGRVQAAACEPGGRAIGTWHNHPPPRVGLAAVDAAALTRNCYLSRTDIADFQRRGSAAVTVVSCAPYTYAYWKRGDVGEVGEDVALLPAPDGQLVQGEAVEDGGASDLTQARRR